MLIKGGNFSKIYSRVSSGALSFARSESLHTFFPKTYFLLSENSWLFG